MAESAPSASARLTGRPVDCLIIDDPIKDREQADSETYRERAKNWWRTVGSTRLAPGAPVVLILCMTGDTPVLLASGIEKPLRDIQPGEAVATYEAGKLRSSYVVNHASQGYDSVYRITTKSGASVRANGRHPFLVIENGTEKWRQTDQIKPGAFILRATGDSIAASNAQRITPDEVVSVEYFGRDEVFDVQIADTENFIADGLISHNTRWHHDDLAGYLLGQPDKDRWRVINIPAQAEHRPEAGESDILGREPGEYMGSARIDERTGLARSSQQWEQTKIQVGPETWAALYQGSPTATTGNILPRDKWRQYDTPLWIEDADGRRFIPGLQAEDAEMIQSWDFTFKDTAASDYVVGQVWLRRGIDAYLLDQVRARMDFTASCQAMLTLSARWPQAIAKLVEDKANGPAILNALRSQVGGLIPVEPEGSKVARARAISPLQQAGNLWLPSPMLAPWVGDFIEEAAQFPHGKNDDQVDGASQAVHRLLLVPILAGQTLYPEDVLGDGVELDWVADLDY